MQGHTNWKNGPQKTQPTVNKEEDARKGAVCARWRPWSKDQRRQISQPGLRMLSVGVARQQTRGRTVMSSLAKTLSICVGFAFTVSCGVPDLGSWDPAPEPIGDSPRTESTSPKAQVQELPEVETKVDDAHVTCEIPAEWSYPYLLENPTDIPVFRTSDENVCLGVEGAGQGARFCNWLTRAEYRFKAITTCHKRALQELESQGRIVYGSLDAWLDARENLVTHYWNARPEAAITDVGQFSGMLVDMINASTQPQAQSEPLCFRRGDRELNQASADVITTMVAKWSNRDKYENALLADLSRGLDIPNQLDPDGRRIEVRIKLVEVPNTYPVYESCVFNLPSNEK